MLEGHWLSNTRGNYQQKEQMETKNPAMRIHTQEWDGQLGATKIKQKFLQNKDMHAMYFFLQAKHCLPYAVHGPIVIFTLEEST